MNDQKTIFVIESNDFAVEQINALLSRFELKEHVEVVEKAPEGADFSVIELSKPYRIGNIVDRICGYLQRQSANTDILDLGGGRYVDQRLGVYFVEQGAEAVRLTEKEIALLVILANAKGEAITREHLLDDVWQYVEGVETHTLETHIYRLRQKIESDPANPQILQTNETGYFLRVE